MQKCFEVGRGRGGFEEFTALIRVNQVGEVFRRGLSDDIGLRVPRRFRPPRSLGARVGVGFASTCVAGEDGPPEGP